MRLRRQVILLVVGVQLSGLAGRVAFGSAKKQDQGAESVEPVTIGVLEFVSKGGVTQETADIMADMLTDEIKSLGNVRVIGRSELRKMLSRDKQKQLAEFEWKCPIASLGIEPVVRWVVAGHVIRVGKLYILNVKLIDLRQELVVGRVSRLIRGGPEDLPGEVRNATQMLFEEMSERLGLGIGAKTVTSAARYRQMIEESPSAITVITRQDIEASGATTIPDLLRLVPGMDVITITPSFHSITARLYFNNENNHFLVLIDGRDAKTEQLGIPIWAIQPISLEDIERIEVIRGTASSLYGADALAGVVSITTRSIPEKESSFVSAAGGEAGTIVLGARTSARFGSWGFSLAGGADFSGMFSDPRISGKQVLKLRSVVEHRWAGSRRLLADAAISNISGPVATTTGMISGDMGLKTLRLAYESDRVRGHVYWSMGTVGMNLDAPLEYAGIRFAEFKRVDADGHTLDGEFQWRLPGLLHLLKTVVGVRGRMSWVTCGECLDAGTYSDMNSPHYRQPGIDYWEARLGGFVHLELALGDWALVTGGLRVDYNNITEEFFSPRAAAVFRVASNHYLRMGVARGFRKPAFNETHMHIMADFPASSPLTGPDRQHFQEFMTRVIGNSDLENEELLSFEAGYVGRFLEGRLAVAMDLYCNLHTNAVITDPQILLDENGLIDLNNSSFMYDNVAPDLTIFGGEISIRLNLTRSISLLAAWSHREIYIPEWENTSDEDPKNRLILGGRFQTESGLLGSLHFFTRSEFWDRTVDNPAGLLEPRLTQHMDNVFLVLGKLGWRWSTRDDVELEAGIRLYLPVSPFSAPYFQYREKGGVLTASGDNYGGDMLRRMLSGYLQGSF